MVVLAVLTMAVGMFTSTLISTARHSRMKREIAIAAEGARRMLELMRSEPCGELVALYDANPADDPSGAGTAPGASFQVAGLEVQADDKDGCTGRILLPVVDNALREDVSNPALGLPRDLNGDRQIDGLDHAGDYLLLPVHVRVEWKGVAGNASFDLYDQFVRP